MYLIWQIIACKSLQLCFAREARSPLSNISYVTAAAASLTANNLTSLTV